MNLQTAIHIVQIAGAISIILGVASFIWSVRNNRRQMNAQMVMKYAERYEKIMDSFPREAFRLRFDLESELPPPSHELTTCVLKYLNLCSEEFYLRKKGYIAQDVWSIWENELHRTLRSNLFRREWEGLRDEFVSYPEFRDFVERTLKKESGI
ncbi:MAG: hypothetical protein AB7U82_00385 [Blastocatellales bacterium]